jgi:hypothetical protein
MSVMLSVVNKPFMLSLVMLNVIVPSGVRLNVMAPIFQNCKHALEYLINPFDL